MRKVTTDEIREYPWGFEPQPGYEYVEVTTCCCADSHESHPFCQVVEELPAGAEPVSTCVLTESGWKRLYRLPQPEERQMIERQECVAIPYETLPCSLREFRYGDTPLKLEWFGRVENVCLHPELSSCSGCEEHESYGCCNMQFVAAPIEDILRTLERAGIDLTEGVVNEILSVLQKTLSIGSCGWCA